jgi:hypothetical protein
MCLFLTGHVQSIATEFEELKGGRFIVAHRGESNWQIKIAYPAFRSKKSKIIMVVLTQDAAQRQSVMGTKDKSSFATDPRKTKING